MVKKFRSPNFNRFSMIHPSDGRIAYTRYSIYAIARKNYMTDMHSFSTLSNLCPCTNVLNADVPSCYITLLA